MRLALVLPVAGSLVLVVVQDCSGETLRQATTPTQTQRVTWVRQFNEPDLELTGVEADFERHQCHWVDRGRARRSDRVRGD